MNELSLLQFGDKQVLASQPYDAPVSPLVGRERETQLIVAAWLTPHGGPPLAPLLLGEPGVGKNQIVYELARLAGKPLYILQGHEDVTAEDLACSVRFSDRRDQVMDYVASPLVTAMARGAICFIDEVAKLRPRALALLASVLDERRYLDSVLLGARVEAHPAFRFIAATNTADLEGNALPEFIGSRLRPVITIGDPSRDEVEAIVSRRYPQLNGRLAPLFDAFWSLWDRHRPDSTPTPRDAVYLFALAQGLADLRRRGRTAERALRANGQGPAGELPAPDVTVADLREAFLELLREPRT